MPSEPKVADHQETEKEILKLVEEAEVKDRAMLLIMFRLHQDVRVLHLNLDWTADHIKKVADASQKHSETLQEHARDEMILINQIKGGWKAATWSFAVIGFLLASLQGLAMREINATREQVAINTTRINILERDNEVQREQIINLKSNHAVTKMQP
jgi:hypothetical protein